MTPSTRRICAILDLPTVANSIKGLYGVDKDRIKAFNSNYGDAWYAAFVAKIGAVEGMASPKTIIDEITTNNISRDLNMDNMIPYLEDAEVYVKLGIDAGTVSASYKSFFIGPLRNSIKNHSIINFNACFKITVKLLTDNHIALAAVGFPATKTTAMTVLHDTAWTLHTKNGLLEVEKKNLVIDNTAIILDLSNDCRGVVGVAKSSFSVTPKDTDKIKLWTMTNIIKSCVPTITKKPVKRKINATATVIYQSSIPENHTMQFTLLKGEKVSIGKSVMKTGIPTATTVLPLNKMMSYHKSEIPGEGEFIKIMNEDFEDARVLVFTIKP